MCRYALQATQKACNKYKKDYIIAYNYTVLFIKHLNRFLKELFKILVTLSYKAIYKPTMDLKYVSVPPHDRNSRGVINFLLYFQEITNCQY